jgi:hypothetical protein
MKFLSYLDHKKLFWPLLALCILFFFLRLPSLIEPYWYGDEGIYHVIGQALNQGYLLYRDIWDNKPPLLYLVYAIANGDQTLVRTLSLFAGLFSVIAFYAISYLLFHSYRITTLTTFLYVLLFATPYLEGNIANAENFIHLPVLLAALVLCRLYFSAKEKIKHTNVILLCAGLLFGLAFLLKIVAIFDFAAFALFLVLVKLQTLSIKTILHRIRSVLPLIIGFVVPIVCTFIYFSVQGILIEFIQGAFAGNVHYVGFENYLFGIPQGLLYLKVVLLLFALILIIVRRKHFSDVALLITLWVLFALFSANFSGRPYIHYILVLLPSFCLLVGLALSKRGALYKNLALIGAVLVASLILFTFPTYGIGKTFAYYGNTLQFLSGSIDVRTYQSFFDSKTPRDYILSAFLRKNLTPEDAVFIWGDSPQLYTLSNKLPPYKYTVAYHVKESPALLRETQETIDREKPKYIVVLPETQPLPFSVPLYIIRFNVEGAIIYERSF